MDASYSENFQSHRGVSASPLIVPNTGTIEVATELPNLSVEQAMHAQVFQQQRELMKLLGEMDLSQVDLSLLSRSDRELLQRLLSPRMTKYIPHVPTAKQSAFLLLDCKEAFYGGAAGGGKSDALLMCGLQYVDIKGYAGIIFRKSYADLSKPGALIERAKDWLFQHPDVKWNEKDKRFEFLKRYGKHTETWSILQFGYLENANDKYNYQGGEYQFIGFDELTHIDIASYRYMFSRLRRLKGIKIPLRVRGASNPPDDDQGLWVKTRFLDEGVTKGRVFIPAGMHDNPFLDVEEYEQALEELDPVTRARLRDGNWEIIRKGNMFKRDWFEVVDSAPPGRRKLRFWDMAASDPEKAAKKNRSNDPDYTVGMLISEYRGIFYVENIVRVRKRPAETEALQKTTAVGDGYRTLIREEQEPGSSGIATIDLKARTLLVGYNYSGIRSTGDKVTRALGTSAAAERGHIKIVRGCTNLEDFFNELEVFPAGSHDDMVDALSGGHSELAILPIESIPSFVEREDNYWCDSDGFSPGVFGRI